MHGQRWPGAHRSRSGRPWDPIDGVFCREMKELAVELSEREDVRAVRGRGGHHLCVRYRQLHLGVSDDRLQRRFRLHGDAVPAHGFFARQTFPADVGDNRGGGSAGHRPGRFRDQRRQAAGRGDGGGKEIRRRPDACLWRHQADDDPGPHAGAGDPDGRRGAGACSHRAFRRCVGGAQRLLEKRAPKFRGR